MCSCSNYSTALLAARSSGRARCAHAQEAHPERLMLSWMRTPRVAGGQEVTPGRFLERMGHPRARPPGLAKTRHSATLRHRQSAGSENKGRYHGGTGGQATPHGSTHRRDRGAASSLPRQHRPAAHINKIMNCLHLEGYESALNCLPRTSFALHYTPAGGTTKKKADHP